MFLYKGDSPVVYQALCTQHTVLVAAALPRSGCGAQHWLLVAAAAEPADVRDIVYSKKQKHSTLVKRLRSTRRPDAAIHAVIKDALLIVAQ
jgi:hypothetical protein